MRNKRNFLFILGLSILCSCSINNVIDNGKIVETYFDDADSLSSSGLNVRIDVQNTDSLSNNVWIKLYLTNLNVEVMNCKVKEACIKRESSGAKYDFLNDSSFVLESEVENYSLYSKELPSRLDAENYSLEVSLSDITYSFKLYRNPENYFSVSYNVDGKIVHTEKVYKGDAFKSNFIYEYPDHLKYAKSWKRNDGVKDNYVTADMELVAVSQDPISWLTTSSDQYSYVNGIDYVFSDKICVIPSNYKNKDICISNYAIRKIDITDLYLPKTLRKIYAGNFEEIKSLKIHYAGTQEEWNAIPNSSTIGKDISVICNSSYAA